MVEQVEFTNMCMICDGSKVVKPLKKSAVYSEKGQDMV